MRGLVLHGIEDIRLEEVADPQIVHPTDAIVETLVAGLCGSDLHAWSGREPARFGVVQGHEAIGTIVDTGAMVESVAPGDRVIVPFTTSCGRCARCTSGLSSRCVSSELFGWASPTDERPPLHGAQAERLRVPLTDGTLVSAPDVLDDDAALLLADNYPTAWFAVARTDWQRGPLAVIGLGAVGLCAVSAARAMGVEEIVAVDPVDARRAAATRLGGGVLAVAPDQVENTVRELPPIGAVVEAAGPPAAQTLAADLAAPGATISIIAVQTGTAFGVDPITAYDKNLTIRTGRAPVRSVLDHLVPAVVARRLSIPTDVVITHPDHTLDAGADLYRAFASREGGIIKATFRP